MQALKVDAVRVLIQHGANVYARNTVGEMPLDLARKRHRTMVQMFQVSSPIMPWLAFIV